MKNENRMVRRFVESYYGQMEYKDEKWESISKDMEENAIIVVYDTTVNVMVTKDVKFLKTYKKYLSDDCINKMVKDEKLPGFWMRELNIENFSIDDMNVIFTFIDGYNVEVTFYLNYMEDGEEISIARA